MTEDAPLPLLRNKEGRFAVWITVAVWLVSSILFVIPMAVAGEHLTQQMVWSLVAIASGGSLVSIALMLVIWKIFESEMQRKIAIAAFAIVLAAILLTFLDLAAAEFFISIQPGNQLSSSRLFRATNNFAVLIPHFTLLGALYALMAHNRRSAKQERLLAHANSLAHQARLSALRYQLNPHFLFNTLNSISALVVTGRNADAEEMLARLSDFLRTTLATNPENPQTLEGELETVDAYLGIERIRFGDRLAISIDCPSELRDAALPHFLLQPLVENAVKHGVAPSQSQVLIRISARTVDDELVVAIENDCPGGRAPVYGTSVGLRNVRERLAAVYGADGHLETIEREAGYIALVRLPLEMATSCR